MAEVQAFFELPELFIALYVVEFGWFFRDGAGRAEFDTFIAVAAVALQRVIGREGEIGQYGYQPDPRSVFRGDQEIISPDPAQTRPPYDLFMRDEPRLLNKTGQTCFVQ